MVFNGENRRVVTTGRLSDYEKCKGKKMGSLFFHLPECAEMFLYELQYVALLVKCFVVYHLVWQLARSAVPLQRALAHVEQIAQVVVVEHLLSLGQHGRRGYG